MTIPAYTVRLQDVLLLPAQYDAILNDLDEIFKQVGLTGVEFSNKPPALPPGPVDAPTPTSLSDAMALLEWYEGEDEVEPSEVVPAPVTVTPTPLDTHSFIMTLHLKVLSEIELKLPGLDGVSLVLNPSGFKASLTFAEEKSSIAFTVGLGIRFQPTLLKPVRKKTAEDGRVTFEPDASRKYVQIEVASVTVEIDTAGDVNVTGGIGVKLTDPVMVGDTGMVIEVADIVLNLTGDGQRPAGTPQGWKGLLINKAALRFPDLFSGPVTATGFGIGSGGISGTIGAGPFLLKYDPKSDPHFTGDLVGQLFGIEGGLKEISLTFQQNIPVGGKITAQMTLPFFETRTPLELDISLTSGGKFMVALSSQDGLLHLNKPDLFDVKVESLGFEIESGLFTLKLNGSLKPLFGGLDWPTFRVKELAIDSEGHVRLDGGWLDLPSQYALDFHGFKIEITKIGFGKTEDGGKWIGFSGGLKLVEGLSAGASVEGLRVIWYEDGRDTKVSLEGVGVEFEVPDVIRFKGAVSYRELPGDVHRFDGSLKLEILVIGMNIDAQLVVGSAPGYTFFAIFIDAALPAGIPLWSTGLALYGLAGLFALNMKPGKKPSQPWYEINSTTDWFHYDKPGVQYLKKWDNEADALAVGGGLTIGTVYDNGYTFSGKMLLVISFPGPILLIQGAANVLKERSSLESEPVFRSLAVLDFRAGTFLFGLDVLFKYDDDGALIKIGGGIEAFFSTSDADAWHVYFGMKEPREKRFRAEIFKLFEANSYFMVDARQLAMGSWIGYQSSWSFGPVSLTIEAWIDGNAVISFKPAHLYGDLWLHGKVALRIFGFGLALSIDARFNGDVFDPFRIHADFNVSVDLPWPLPDFSVGFALDWGPTPNKPPLPLPLKEVAVEHFKVTTSWPLPREGAHTLLLPNYDTDKDGFMQQPPVPSVAAQELLPAPTDAPVVPLDARPHITFGRAVHDLAKVGVNAQMLNPEFERIGDPAKNEGPTMVKYGLREVALHKYVMPNWQLVARKAETKNPNNEPELFGSWAPTPAMPDGGGLNTSQVKLWLWSKTPFDYTRHSGRAWDDWFTGRFKDYPCIPPPPDREVCCNFESIDPTKQLTSPWSCSGDGGLVISWLAPSVQNVSVLSPPVLGHAHALCFPARAANTATHEGSNEVTITPPEPARTARIIVISDDTPEQPDGGDCVSFEQSDEGVGPNPRREQEVTFEALDAEGRLLRETNIVHVSDPAVSMTGLYCANRLVVRFPQGSSSVTLSLFSFTREVSVEAFDAEERVVARAEPNPESPSQTLTLNGRDLRGVFITSREGETYLQDICYETEPGKDDGEAIIEATGFDKEGRTFGPFEAKDNVIDVRGEEMVSVRLRSTRRFCLLKACVNIGPDPAKVTEREELMKHLLDELGRWSQTGATLEPHTTYRLKIVTSIKTTQDPIGDFENTEFVYFRTEGAPGLSSLSTPIGLPNPAEFNSGLDDLTRYVRQTIPPTVPGPGEKPLLPRPVYRAYDVGAEFNEDYVDLMYRLDERDLGLYLYDNNNRPVRDARGRLMVLSNQWGHTEDLTLSRSDKLWINVVNSSNCAALDTTVIPFNTALSSAAEGQVLNADTVYEARLIPLLLHDAFTSYAKNAKVVGPSGTLGRWSVFDEGTDSAPSEWEVREEGTPPSRFIIQTSNIWGKNVDAADPDKPGALLLRSDSPEIPSNHPEQPGNWTDYRLSLYLRSEDDDAIGLVFRYRDAKHYYRFSMDRERSFRRLIKMDAGKITVLAEDDFVYQLNQDYLITVEAIGPSLRIYQDGELVFDVADSSHTQGRFGLYCWANEGARFSDVRVDDFRAAAPVVYRFSFTTSRFADFFHHLHSYQDEVWRVTLTGGVDISPHVSQAVEPTTATTPADAEARAYEALATQVLGQAAKQNPPELQITRVEQNNEALAFLVQSPEPIDWKRTDFELLHVARQSETPQLPRALKLTDIKLGTIQPNEESVTILLREPFDLSGHRVEYKQMPGVIAEPGGNPQLFVEDFRNATGGLLFTEAFGPNALDHYEIVDEGIYLGPSSWAVASKRITQTSNIYGGSVAANAPEKPGTIALTGSVAWGDIRISATVRSQDDDSIGIVFRYLDARNYYRFSMDAERSFRRLIKMKDGQVTTLWEDNFAYTVGQAYRLLIEAAGDQLLVYQDDVLLCGVRDGEISSGRVGLYCWANQEAYFEALVIEALASSIVLWQPAFKDTDELQLIDEPGAVKGPSAWAAGGGTLTQSSAIQVADTTPHKPGTYALGGSKDWRDVDVSAILLSNGDGALGVMFRYRDADNYYRFSMDYQGSYRRLVKKVAGHVTTLWEDAVQYKKGTAYQLRLSATGRELKAYLDGSQLFNLQDNDLKYGRIALYSWANTGAHFKQVLVSDRTRRVGQWLIRDEGTTGAPSVWSLAGGALRQLSAIGGGTPPGSPGTMAVAGRSHWQDYRLSVQLRSDTDEAIGIVFRYRDDDNYYLFSIDQHNSYRRLIKKAGTSVTTLWQSAGGFASGQRMSMTVDAIGSRLVGYLDGEQLFDVNDADLSAGQVGLYCQSNPGARFEKIEVRRPGAEASLLFRDNFHKDKAGWTIVDEGTDYAPSAWAVQQGTLRQTSEIFTPPIDRDTLGKQGTYALAGSSSWTDVIVSARLQSFDDDAIGLLFRYADADNYYRFSMDSQRGYRRLVKNVGGKFSLLWEEAAGYDVGRAYELTLVAKGKVMRGYLDGLPIFVVEDGDLASGRIGLYCWGNTDARFSQIRVHDAGQAFNDWLLDEPFATLVGDRWTFVDEGTEDGPSKWLVKDGSLRQTSTISGGDKNPAVPDKPGTNALAGSSDWTDYCLSVSLISEKETAMGVLFRYRDADNYYRFSMDRQGSYRRLIKKVAGHVTTLWEDAVQYTVGQAYLLTLDCVGDRLTGYLDGTRLFSIADRSLSEGRVGLYCWANDGARFNDVRVAAPAWHSYYTFGREEHLPAGTRLQIFAGSAAQAPPASGGVVQRFLASVGEQGHLRLSPGDTDLRLIAPDETHSHARKFLPPGEYAKVTARVLRKQDGTGFFVIVPEMSSPGTKLKAGLYRLRMTFRLNNKTLDPASQTLSKAGRSDAEQVVLDLPWQTR